MIPSEIHTDTFEDREWFTDIVVSLKAPGTIEIAPDSGEPIVVPTESVPELVLALLVQSGYVDEDAGDIEVTDLTILANAVVRDRLARYTRILHHMGVFLDSQYLNLGKKTIPLYERMNQEFKTMTRQDREYNDTILGKNGELAA
jgi:hypothetical protein